jgi:molybdopterin/thiamine biosynthesis adenylyltransferase
MHSSSAYRNYFYRQIELWGLETQKSLLKKSILIVGCGGLGSSVAYSLCSSGIGEIDLIDFDEVAIHNIHRQIAYNIDDVGKNKAKTLASKQQKRNPFAKIRGYSEGFEEFANSSTTEYDLIIDATDNLPIRREIDTYAKENSIPWVYGSVEEFHGQVCFFDKTFFDDIFKVLDHKPKGIVAPSVLNIASFQSILALRYLAGLEVVKDKLHFIGYGSGTIDAKSFDI